MEHTVGNAILGQLKFEQHDGIPILQANTTELLVVLSLMFNRVPNSKWENIISQRNY